MKIFITLLILSFYSSINNCYGENDKHYLSNNNNPSIQIIYLANQQNSGDKANAEGIAIIVLKS